MNTSIPITTGESIMLVCLTTPRHTHSKYKILSILYISSLQLTYPDKSSNYILGMRVLYTTRVCDLVDA